MKSAFNQTEVFFYCRERKDKQVAASQELKENQVLQDCQA